MTVFSWPEYKKIIGESECADLAKALYGKYREVVECERIEIDALPQLDNIYIPLAAWIASKHSSKPVVIGINGAQGSGKTTLSKILQSLLIHGFDKSVVHLSIDDLYLPRQQREYLAETVHPLLKTRGVPGTHDVELGIELLSALVDGDFDQHIMMPIFDKAHDDLLGETEWEEIDHPVDIILFEGWCVASKPQNDIELQSATNALEKNNDQDGIWRKYVNSQLSGPYSELFGFIDHLIMLQVPGMNSVIEWRKIQENKLKEQCIKLGKSTDKIMSGEQIERFIMHFERLTRHMLDEMPKRSDVLLKIGKNHQVSEVRVR